jgi:hypothetical protein
MPSVGLEQEWERIVGLLLERTDALLRPAECPSLFDLRSIPVAAALVGIHPKSLYRLVEQGRVQAYGSRGFLKVSMAELLKPVERRAPNKLKNAARGGVAPSAEQPA